VLDDPRWDRQVEERDDYYARLLLATHTDIDPLRRYILQESHAWDEANFWLPLGALARMSRRGGTSAGDALAEAVRSGPRWRACLDALEAAGGVELIDQVVSAETVQALVARVGIDDVVDAVAVVAAPWESWAERVPVLRSVVRSGAGSTGEARPMSIPVAWAASRLRRPRIPENLPAMSTESLLALGSTPGAASQVSAELTRRKDDRTWRLLSAAAKSGTAEERRVALRALGTHGSTEFLVAAEEFLRRESALAPTERREHRLRRGFLLYLEELPSTHTLPLARRWFSESWPLSLAAELILARHATRDDLQMLETAGAAALASDDMYRLCSIVDAIGKAGPDLSLPLLGEVYEHAPYSYARRRVVEVMSRCGLADPANGYLTEALWDCEPESRELACRALKEPRGPAWMRIAELARDPYEGEEVREAARRVLEEE